MTNIAPPPVVDWTLPPGKQDWLLGTGASPPERRLVWSATAAAAAAACLVAVAAEPDWQWWHWLLVVVLAVDVAGGVPANALATAKRLYHSAPQGPAPLRHRVARSHVAFSALHVHPFAAAALLPDAGWLWALAWYAVSLAGTAAVVAAPLYLRRPLAAAVVAVAVVAAPIVHAPVGLEWLGPVLVLKLVLAHAVREEPYRPATSGPR